MQTVCLHILQVVETIYRTGYQTERGKYDQRRPEEISFQKSAAEEDRGKNKDVFEPLQWSKQLNI
jgi:hypothetical protein